MGTPPEQPGPHLQEAEEIRGSPAIPPSGINCDPRGRLYNRQILGAGSVSAIRGDLLGDSLRARPDGPPGGVRGLVP